MKVCGAALPGLWRERVTIHECLRGIDAGVDEQRLKRQSHLNIIWYRPSRPDPWTGTASCSAVEFYLRVRIDFWESSAFKFWIAIRLQADILSQTLWCWFSTSDT
jgi:hypothetical protein